MDHVRLSHVDHCDRRRGTPSGLFLVGLMVCTWLVVDALIAKETILLAPRWPEAQIGLLLGSVFGQAALLAYWLVHRITRPALPALVTTITLGSFAYAAALVTDGIESTGRWCTLLAIYVVLAGLAHSSALWKRLSFTNFLRSPWQMSLATIFCLMTLSATSIAFLRWAEPPRKPFLLVLAFCSLLALLAKVAADALEDRQPLFGRLIVCSALTCVVVGCLRVTHLAPANSFMLAIMATTQVLWIVITLAIIRTADHRCSQPIDAPSEHSK